MRDALRIGIAGLGRMGRRHAENLARRVTGAMLIAACSPVDEERAWAEQTLGVQHTFAEYATMLARPDVDAVFLVTPTTLHAQQIIDALHAGKHVKNGVDVRADRKSTRLNSSHRCTSYAVFCLTKKRKHRR